MVWTKIADLRSTVPGPPGEPGLPGVNAIENATAVAAYMTSDSAVRDAMAARTGVVDTDYASLEAALTATPAGGILEVHGTYSRTTTFTIDKACTVRFWPSASITVTNAAVAAITVTANGVTLDGARVFGTGNATGNLGAGITAIGTVAAPILNLTIEHPEVGSFSKWGIYLEQVQNFTVDRANVHDIAYAGIAMLSCVNGQVTRCDVTSVTMPTGFVDSYGIIATRDSSASMAVAPRSSNITIRGCTVIGVTNREGIDTHAGANITIVDNTVLNCKVGIALVTCPDPSGADTWAPRNAYVAGNYVDSGVTDGSAFNGIHMAGAGSVVGSPVEPATGIITNNTVVGHGTDATTGAIGGIDVYNSDSVIISKNRIIRPSSVGIYVYNTNANLVLSDNTIEDAWANIASFSASIYVRSTNNALTVSGTQIVRGTKTATFVNSRGLYIGNTTANTIVDAGGNAWQNAATPQVGQATTVVSSLNGAAPVVRAAAITSPTADVAALKTAVDAIRTALKNIGITL